MTTIPTPTSVGARDDRYPIDCQQCVLLRVCTSIPNGDAATECDDVRAARRRSLTPGAVLYRRGDPVRGIFVVRAGALKLSDVATSGEEFVIGFALPGEPAGLEALAGYRYQRHATALRSVAYCEIPIRQFLRVFGGAPRVPAEMLRITAAALDMSMHRASIAHRDARARVAAFLLDISQRLAGKGIRSADFFLPMPRRDIAAYLGLSLETVSRVLQDLHRRGLIAVRARAVRLQAFNQLACLAWGAPESALQPA